MMQSNVQAHEPLVLPSLLLDPEMLVPVKIDITYKGARLVDSFCMSIKSSPYDVLEVSWQTCTDYNLPSGFQWRVYLQIQEHIVAYREIVNTFLTANDVPCTDYPNMNSLLSFHVALRHGTVDYSDKFHWDATAASCSPEDFAKITCADLGLPMEMEPAIAHRIRESVMR